MSNQLNHENHKLKRQRRLLILWSIFFSLALLLAIVALIVALDVRTDVKALQEDSASGSSRALVQDVRDDFGALMDTMQVVGVFVGLMAAFLALVGVDKFSEVQHRVDENIKENDDKLQSEIKKLDLRLGEATERFSQQHNALDRALLRVDEAREETESKAEELRGLHKDVTKTQEQAKQTSLALALTELAQYQMRLGNDRVAREQLEEAHRQDPENETIAFLLGDVLSRQGDFQMAKYILREKGKADEKPGGDFVRPWAVGTLAYVLRVMGDKLPSKHDALYDEANDLFEQLWASTKHKTLLDTHGESVFGAWGGLRYRQGKALIKDGRHEDGRKKYQEAITYYKHAASVTLRNSYPINNLGLIYFEISDPNTEKESADNNLNTARVYFWNARRKALGKYLTNSDDYYAVFDLITARLALDAIKAEWNGRGIQASNESETLRSEQLGPIEAAVVPENAALLKELIAAMEFKDSLNQLMSGLNRLKEARWFNASPSVGAVKKEIDAILKMAEDALENRRG